MSGSSVVGCWLRYVVRLAFRPLDQGGTNSNSRSQDIRGWRNGTCRSFAGASCRYRLSPLRNHGRNGCDFFRRFCFQYLGNHADARGAASRGPVDWFPEFRWQPCRDCGTGSHWARAGSDRPVLLAIRHTHCDRIGRCNFLAILGWTCRAGGLAQDFPSRHRLQLIENELHLVSC